MTEYEPLVSLVDAHGGVERYEMEWNTHTHEFVCVCANKHNGTARNESQDRAVSREDDLFVCYLVRRIH